MGNNFKKDREPQSPRKPVPTKKQITDQKRFKNGVLFCAATMQGWRQENQDAILYEQLGNGVSLFGVFDGHGGEQVSQYVQKHFVNALIDLESFKNKNYDKALIQCFTKIDEMIGSDSGQKQLKNMMYKGFQGSISQNCGTTAHVILITQKHYFIANLGDCRSAIYTKNNQCKQLSQDHRPELATQKKRIQQAGGIVKNGRINNGLNLSRSLGDFQYKNNKNLLHSKQMISCQPQIRKEPISDKDDFIIMGCDGIWDRYKDNSQGLCKKIKELLKQNKQNYKITLQKLLDFLIAKQNRQPMGRDNMSAILIGFK